jgi:serine phosphatase RsbU (regulator of sigma subunit)
LVTARAITMLKDGARDGAVARAVHDYLYGYRHGQVSATLNILSVDFSAQTLVMSRNNPLPFYVLDREGLHSFNEPSTAIGLYANTKPVITQHSIQASTYIVAFTDGVMQAGERYGTHIDLSNYLASLDRADAYSAQTLADQVLLRAMEHDRNRPLDDMSVLVLAILETHDEQSNIRRMAMQFPLERPRR